MTKFKKGDILKQNWQQGKNDHGCRYQVTYVDIDDNTYTLHHFDDNDDDYCDEDIDYVEEEFVIAGDTKWTPRKIKNQLNHLAKTSKQN